MLGLELGNAPVIRNIGGRITPAVLHTLDLLALDFSTQTAAVAEADKGDLIVLQHNPCRDRRDPRGSSSARPARLVVLAVHTEVSGADVAETTYTAFAGKHAMQVRLIVRRVRPTPGSQLALFTTFDYHAFVTDRTGPMLEIG